MGESEDERQLDFFTSDEFIDEFIDIRKEFMEYEEKFNNYKAKYEFLKAKLDLYETADRLYGNYHKTLDNENSLCQFLESEKVILGPGLHCLQSVFVRAFDNYCKENHLSYTKWKNQFYTIPFSKFKLKVKKDILSRYQNVPEGHVYISDFIMGVDIRNEEK